MANPNALRDRRGTDPAHMYALDPWFHKWISQTRLFMRTHRP